MCGKKSWGEETGNEAIGCPVAGKEMKTLRARFEKHIMGHGFSTCVNGRVSAERAWCQWRYLAFHALLHLSYIHVTVTVKKKLHCNGTAV